MTKNSLAKNFEFMGIIRYISIVLLFAVSITNSSAQKEGQLKVFTRPNESLIKVDTTNLKATNITTLSEGNHRVRIWSEGYHLFDTIVFVKADTVTVLKRPLDITAEYSLYLEESDKHYKKTLPLCIFIGGTAASVYFYRQMKINQWAAKKYKEDFEYLKIDDQKSQTEKLYKHHLGNKNKNLSMQIVSMAISTGAVAMLVHSLTIAKPVFKGKGVLLSFSPNIYRPVSSELGLNVNF